MTKLSIIIVNYRSLQLIEGCLESIYRYDNPGHFEIIIIDNSGDEPASLLQKFPAVRWIPMNYNAGFAKANNKGIESSNGDVVLLLNPDILVEDDAISKCFLQFTSSNFAACLFYQKDCSTPSLLNQMPDWPLHPVDE